MASLTDFGSSGMARGEPGFRSPTDEEQLIWTMERPEQAAGQSAIERYLGAAQPIKQMFDPKMFLTDMAASDGMSNAETRKLKALGYALQLSNPSFDPTAFIKKHQVEAQAAQKRKYDYLSSANAISVDQEIEKRMAEANPNTIDEFEKVWNTFGIYNSAVRKKHFDLWEQFNPYVDPLERTKATRAMRNTARDDVAALVKDPIKRIKTIEDAAIKVRITTQTPTAADRQWVLDNYAIGAIKSDDPDKEAKGIRDIALINSYQRMIDPATVREGDVALQRASASLLERVDIWFERIMDGTFLKDSQRQEMQRLADEFYFHTIRNNLDQVLGARDVFVSRYTGTTGDARLTETDIDSDFYSKVPKSAITKWQREYKKGQTRMKASSKERPVVISEEEEKEYYLPGTIVSLNGNLFKVK